MTEISEVRYARSAEGTDIAYRTAGRGPVDLVFVSGFISHLDLMWELPGIATHHHRLASMGRVVFFDKRGTGLSDRSLGFGSVADRMDDIRAVMDAAEVERAVIYGISEGGPLALVFAATYPDRVSKLWLSGTFARVLRAPDYDCGLDPEVAGTFPAWLRREWGTGRGLFAFCPDVPEDALPLLARYERASCTPQLVEQIMERNIEIDVRPALATINVPTLVVHNAGDTIVPVAFGRYLAEHISGARYVEVPRSGHILWDVGAEIPPEAREFVSGQTQQPDLDRMLATVLFTDIVGSTHRAAELGDQGWRDLLDHHDRIARGHVERFRGRLVKSTGDGLLATFDGPARGIQCAQAIRRALGDLGVEIRAGLHTGEIELRGKDITGLGVVIASRICDLAPEGELLASRTVKDLVAGSGLGFADRGTHALKGVPDEWQLYAVA